MSESGIQGQASQLLFIILQKQLFFTEALPDFLELIPLPLTLQRCSFHFCVKKEERLDDSISFVSN